MSTPARKETIGKRLAHSAIPITCLIGLFGFWRLAPVVTFAIALAAFVALVVALWVAGKD